MSASPLSPIVAAVLRVVDVPDGWARLDGRWVRLVPWGGDCLDCGGDFTPNDRCDICGEANLIPVYVTEADSDRMTQVVR